MHSPHTPRLLVVAVLHAFAASAAAQQPQQQVRPPIAQYWMNAETLGGMAAMGGPGAGGGNPMDIARMMMGGGSGAVRSLHLQLGSSQAAAGEPRADHAIPPAMNMGESLPLVTPKVAPREREPVERELPQGIERPKGRMKIYWGCGETARPGQPVVIDFARVAAGQVPPGLSGGVRVSVQTPPGPGRSRTYGEWPNEDRRVQVPEGASMRGDHAVRGNYSPDIRFAIGERHDFLPAVQLTPQVMPSGARRFQWQSIPAAQGYFAMAMGAAGQDEFVFWTSSEVQEMGGSLFDYLSNAEVARLVREKVVMSPQTTECAVPAEAAKDMGGMPMLRFVAYGEELNFVHPPRPQDPRQPWLQEWAVKVRNRSVLMAPLAEGMGGMMDARQRPSRPGRAEPPTAPAAGDTAAGTAPPDSTGGPSANPGAAVQDGVREGVRILRGIFGR